MDLLIWLLIVGAVTFALALWSYEDEADTTRPSHDRRNHSRRGVVHRRPR